MKGTDMQTIHTKAGFKVLRESLGQIGRAHV